jgi:hypothetical protein
MKPRPPPSWVTSGADDPSVPLELVLPLPPSGNHAHKAIVRRGKRGRLVQGKALTDEAVAYRLLVRMRVRALTGKFRAPAGTFWFQGPVRLELVYTFADWRRRDLDNLRKQLQDALTGCAWADDVQVVQPIEERRRELGEASVRVRVSRATGEWAAEEMKPHNDIKNRKTQGVSPLPVPPPRDDVEGQRQWAELEWET